MLGKDFMVRCRMAKQICTICGANKYINLHNTSSLTKRYLEYNIYLCRMCRDEIVEGKYKRLLKEKMK